ncbi:hypothetical protein GOL87_27620 [Sinorhizobium medicae]|nr:hypothetical protein [Sinorhizobium medicae]
MTDELRKLLEQQRKLQEVGNLGELREAALAFQKFRDTNDLGSRLAEMQAASTAFKEAIGAINHHNSMSELVSERLRGFQEIGETFRQLERQFVLPDMSAIQDLLKTYPMDLSAAMREALGGVDGIRDRMAALRTSWLDFDQQALSARAFLDIQMVGGLVSASNAFSVSIATALRTELGDWRDPITFNPPDLIDPSARLALYDGLGFNANLTHFTEEAYQETVQIAGLAVIEDLETVEEDEGMGRNSRAYESLLRFEREIRAFIVAVMTARFGARWMKQQLPNGMLDRWMEKRETDIQHGAEAAPLIEYADFTDYKAIIERGDNWTKVFQPIFGRKEDVRESFQRLFPVRIATMHARIITLDDDLILRAETTRVLGRVRRYKN